MRVNKGIGLPMNDFVIPGNVITKEIESNHIFSKKKFVTLEGFDKKRCNHRVETSEHDRQLYL